MRKLVNKLKTETKRNNKKDNTIIILYAFFIVLIAVMLVLYIGQSFKIDQLSYKKDILNEKLKSLEEENHEYKLKVAKKSSLSNIEQIARNKISMIDPEKTEVVVLKKGDSRQNPVITTPEENPQVIRFFASLVKSIGTVRASSPN